MKQDSNTRPEPILREDWFTINGDSASLAKSLFLIFAVSFGVWHMATNLFINEQALWQNGIHFAGFVLLASVLYSSFSSSYSRRIVLILDIAYGVLVALSVSWVIGSESRIYEDTLAITGQSWQFNSIDWVAGLLVIFAAIDFSRRVAGWVIPILIVLSLSYILFLGEHLPGVFRTASLPPDDVLFRTMYNDEGVFGILAGISSTNIALFMIFGGFLVVSGASDFVIELSKLVAGRVRGGAAFVAVIASALTGTISGSAIANTASTGVITIPLMKSNGFSGKFAAGVEAAASTGGQLMPPIMGAGAFVMASYTAIPYSSIVSVSIIPAILYFLSVAFNVRIEAVRGKIDEGIDMRVDWKKIIAGGVTFIIPLTVMIGLLMAGVTPSYAASVAIAALISVSWLSFWVGKLIRLNDLMTNVMSPKRISEALLLGMRSSILTAILLVSIGIINNAIVTSGVGNGFSLMIAQWSQGSIVIALILIALASLVLGMGLPVTAAYIILAILSAPALAGLLADSVIVEKLAAGINDPTTLAMFSLVNSPIVEKIPLGLTSVEAAQLMSAVPFEVAMSIRPMLVDPQQLTAFLLTAHLIIFWLSQDSNVTPPVCLAAFTAAGIAKSPPMATGFQAWKIAKGLYIVPLLFAYTPLISGTWIEAVQIGLFSTAAIYGSYAVTQRFAEGQLGLGQLIVMGIGVVGSFWPLNLPVNILGAGMIIAVTIWSRRRAIPSG